MFSSFVACVLQCGFILLEARPHTSFASIICLAVGFEMTKHENMPHSDNVIWKSVSGNYIEKFFSVGSIVWIFGVLFALIPASLITKMGMRLFRINGTDRALRTTKMHVLPLHRQLHQQQHQQLITA
jgi:Na+/citrate or Na+/malate symporter